MTVTGREYAAHDVPARPCTNSDAHIDLAGGGLIGFTPFIPGTDGFIGNLDLPVCGAAGLRQPQRWPGGHQRPLPRPRSSGGPLQVALRAPAPGTDNPGNTMASARAVADACGFYEGEVQHDQ
jgi:hypothetical protein